VSSDSRNREPLGVVGRAPSERISEKKTVAMHSGRRSGVASTLATEVEPRKPGLETYPDEEQKSLAAKYYRLKYRHAPTAKYRQRFGQRDDDQCW